MIRSTLRLGNKLLIAIVFAVLVVACTPNNTITKYSYNKNAKYIALVAKNSDFFKEETSILTFDDEGNILDKMKFLDYDFSGDTTTKNNIFFHGPGGLIRVNKLDYTVEKIEDNSVDDVESDDEGNVYYYKNGGFSKDGNKKYISTICKLTSTDLNCQEMDRPISEIFKIGNNLYVKSYFIDEKDELLTLDSQTFEIIKKETFENKEDRPIYKVNNKLYLKKNDTIVEYGQSNPVFEMKTQPYVIYSSASKIIYIHPETSEQEHVIVEDVLNKKQLFRLENNRNFNLEIESDTDTIIQNFYHDKEFRDLKTNKTIKIDYPFDYLYAVKPLK